LIAARLVIIGFIASCTVAFNAIHLGLWLWLGRSGGSLGLFDRFGGRFYYILIGDLCSIGFCHRGFFYHGSVFLVIIVRLNVLDCFFFYNGLFGRGIFLMFLCGRLAREIGLVGAHSLVAIAEVDLDAFFDGWRRLCR